MVTKKTSSKAKTRTTTPRAKTTAQSTRTKGTANSTVRKKSANTTVTGKTSSSKTATKKKTATARKPKATSTPATTTSTRNTQTRAKNKTASSRGTPSRKKTAQSSKASETAKKVAKKTTTRKSSPTRKPTKTLVNDTADSILDSDLTVACSIKATPEEPAEVAIVTETTTEDIAADKLQSTDSPASQLDSPSSSEATAMVPDDIGNSEHKLEATTADSAQAIECVETSGLNDPTADNTAVSNLDPDPVDAESENPEGSFVVLLDDEPEQIAAEDESSSDSFLILFDDDDPEDRTAIEENDGNYKISFAGDICLNNIVKLKSRLDSTFDAIGIEFDATAVEAMDTSSVQMLLAYTNNLKNSSIPIKWTGTSKCFESVSKTLGISLID